MLTIVPPKPVGSKVLAVTPVPVKVPPPEPVINGFRLIGVLPSQIGLGLVHVASKAETVMV